MKCISSIQHAWRNFSASCSVTRSNSTLSVPTPVRIHSPACVTLQQGAAVVAAPTTFERLRAVASQLRAGLALVALCPFAPPVFQPASSLLRTLLTSRSLAWSKSPRVRTWTIDPCRRALPQGSFGDGWISRSLARLSPTCGLTARSCAYGRVFDTPFFQLRLAAYTLGFSTVGVTPSGQLLADHKYHAHAGHTRVRNAHPTNRAKSY